MRVPATGSNGLIGPQASSCSDPDSPNGQGWMNAAVATAPGWADRPGAGARLRVLHTCADKWFGGVEMFLLTLARHRRLCPGLEPHFAICSFGGRLGEGLRAAGAAVHPIEPVRFSRPWTVLRARRHLLRVLAEVAPDVVICHSCWPHALFAPVARRAGHPVVFWMHDRVSGTHWLERLAARTPPDLAVVNSRSTAAGLPYLFPGVRHEVLYYPVAPPLELEGDRAAHRARLRRELGASEEDVVIIQASRLERWKGQSLLIEALGHLRDRRGWVAWLAGGVQRPQEQAYWEELKAAAEAAGIAGRVRFLGQRSDVPQLLAAADLHCQPNLGPEPFGITFIEALYAGLPVVSTRMGGAAEIITEECGVLVPPGDTAALAATLTSLLNNPDRCARLGAAGPARARALCDPAATLGQLHTLLAQITQGERGYPSCDVA